MEIRLIKAFQTIVKLGSFQRAAEALQYSQPTITIQIKKLEDELGVRLFERGKTITLTNAGRLFLERADSLLQEYDVLNSTLSDFINGDAGTVRLGATEPSASNRLPGILARYAALKPKVQINVAIGSTREMTRMLLEDQIDFALCNQPEPHIDLAFDSLFRETFTLLLPSGHALASKDEVRLQDLKNEKMLFTPGTCPFRIRIEEMITSQIGQLRHAGMEVTGINAIKYFVQAGMGIALSPEVAVTPPIPGTVIKSVKDLLSGPPLGLLYKRNTDAQSRIAIDLKNEIKRQLLVES
ncbi:LysR family transcriptional regulator [Paenibacillus luteus]|uniref:LysR family transcriptional regulator n=1 Tax=Paenibacillus luteus TaxID=2545753 RepID=UPI001141BC04|nr:LysR family transcriptional regulator [Paenibacillus luteus]